MEQRTISKKNLGKKYMNKISFTHRYPNRHCYRKTTRHLFPLLQSNRAEIVKDSRTRGERKCDAMESITGRKTVNDRGKNSQINRVSKLDACAKFWIELERSSSTFQVSIFATVFSFLSIFRVRHLRLLHVKISSLQILEWTDTWCAKYIKISHLSRTQGSCRSS